MVSGEQQQLEDFLEGIGRCSLDGTTILLTSLRPSEVAVAANLDTDDFANILQRP